MEESQQRIQKVIKISKKKLIWRSIAIVILAILIWLGTSFYYSTRGIGVGGSLQSSMIPGVPSNTVMPSGYGRNKSGIEDTREFMKTNYSGTVKTRDVAEVVYEVEEMVRDLDGRVDSVNSSEKSGYVSFVIPKDDLFEFKYRMKELTHEKLYIESTSSQNLLYQKQDIEERTGEVSENMEDLQAQKASLDSAHAQRTSALQNQISAIQAQINEIYRTMPAADDVPDSEIMTLQDQANALTQSIAQLRITQTKENQSYASQSSALEAQINRTEGNLSEIAEEDVDFMNDIETVNGSVRAQWVSHWELIKIFSPIPVGFEIVIVVVIIWYVLKRKRYLPKVELV